MKRSQRPFRFGQATGKGFVLTPFISSVSAHTFVNFVSLSCIRIVGLCSRPVVLLRNSFV